MIEHFKASGWRVRLVYAIIAFILLMGLFRQMLDMFGILHLDEPLWWLWSY